MKHSIILLWAILTISTTRGQRPWASVQSPDHRLSFRIFRDHELPYYEAAFDGKTFIQKSRLGLRFRESAFRGPIGLTKPAYRTGTEQYRLLVGKVSQVEDPYQELRIGWTDLLHPGWQMDLVVRVFNSGIAFRYELKAGDHSSAFAITDELSEFNFSEDPVIHTLQLPNYRSSHEGEYTVLPFSQLKADSLMDLPTLVEYPGKLYVGITEANLQDYAGMYLEKKGAGFVTRLSPRIDSPELKVTGTLPHPSPWRVLLVSDRIGALIESNLITDLNEDPKMKDWSWLKPGKTTFPWWNGNVLPDTINAPGNNFVTQKYYIDFCARAGLEYHSVVEYGLHQWYMDDGISFQPGPHADVTRPVPGLDMKEVCDYGKSVGVGIRVWVHFYALYPKLDSAFALFEKWGLQGMMVDFMDRDDQQMVNMQNEVLRKAAEHHLHIQFHGAYKPTGLHRTWPNEFTREGTLNYEANKWSKRVTPDHDLHFPFTRMLAGSTDYHLGGFRAVPDSAFVVQYTRPLMMGTRCHMLAMYVVLENYLGMVCDYPEAYEGQAGFDFIKAVPTTWDETRVLDAKPDEYIIIARRKGKAWYVGALTNHQARDLRWKGSFLGNGKYEAAVYQDAVDSRKYPNHLESFVQEVDSKADFTLRLTEGGGAVIRLIPKE